MQMSTLRVRRLALAVNLAVLSLACARPVMAQASAPNTPAAPAVKKDEKTLGTVRVTADKPVETEAKETYQAVTSTIGKGKQALRDIPQSVTVVTEKLIDDRNLDTLKDVLQNTAGATFLAAEGGEEDIRLRGFSLQQTGDIFVDGMRDPAIYSRDTFNYDRVEVLRGSASMLFGRGSTGGAVNQVSKQAFMLDQKEIDVTYATGNHIRAETDLNFITGQDQAFRLTGMKAQAENDGAGSSIDKEGVAGNYRYGIGNRHELQLSLYYLKNRNGINYGLPWVPEAGGSGSKLVQRDPSNYYGVDSDYANSDVLHATATHILRLAGGGELKTSFRAGKFERDQRASAVRFAPAAQQPGGLAVNTSTISDNTVLTRGTNNKTQDLTNEILQSDYTDKFKWFGMTHAITSGLDINHENRETFTTVNPAGVNFTKVNTTLGDIDGTAGVDESKRGLRRSAEFDSTAAGVYFQDLAEVAKGVKLLGGLRYDYFSGTYWTTNAVGDVNATRGRHDKLLSKRVGLLLQPTPELSFHASYGTSFNTSGDTYAYDALSSNTDPEKSRNIEIGGKFDVAGGGLSVRTAIFHSTKYNERNTDTESVSPTNFVLSGARYTKGAEFDVAGRIAPNWEVFTSYTWIPVAKVKNGALTGSELVGSRPGLIPKHQGSLWTTYKFNQAWRAGAGASGRTKMYPLQINNFQVEGYVTYDAMVEYTMSQALAFKFNASNLTNKLYADNVYRGHYVPGKGRTFALSANYKF